MVASRARVGNACATFSSTILHKVDAQLWSLPGIIIAQRLLGMTLYVRTEPGEMTSGRIVETEYYGADDPASHSFRGLTPRCRAMFGPAGTVYVYRSYGVHWCLNVVCGARGIGEAILIRAVEPTEGIEEMRRRRGMDASEPPERLASGPGRLCQAFGVDGTIDGGEIALDRGAAAPLAIDGDSVAASRILATRRIGISRAEHLFRRFVVSGSRALSRPVPNRLSRRR